MLFACHSKKFYYIAFALLRNKEDAEDALQDAMLSAYTHLRSFEGRSRFSTWLGRIVRNSALMTRRKLNTYLPVPLDEMSACKTQRVPAEFNPEEVCIMAEVRELVSRGMSELSIPLRLALQLCHLESLSTKEAAEVASVAVSTMKGRSLKARHQLALALADIQANPVRSGFVARILRRELGPTPLDRKGAIDHG
jgi:RNA polymerase sigma-70 factor, ECF subfamily